MNNQEKTANQAPLAGVRVLNLGGVWAGRVAAMLLADQGADVMEINSPQLLDDRSAGALLSRGKTVVTLDLKSPAGQRKAFELGSSAHIVIDNLGPGRAERFGLGYAKLAAANKGVVYLSLPAFASDTPESALLAKDGAISAAVGVFTDLSSSASIMGSRPIYTAIPMASAYGGVHGATAATLAFYHFLGCGEGQFVEVPLSDAVLSGMAALAMRIEGQPEQYDQPRVDLAMKDVAFPIFRDLSAHLTDEHLAVLKGYLQRFHRPQFAHHKCADGRFVFINAADHVHQARACLEQMGLLNQLIAEGMVLASPFDEAHNGNNLSSSTSLSPFWSARLTKLMAERFLTRPAHEWQTLLQNAGVPCSMVRTTKEWLRLPEAIESGCVIQLDDAEFGPVHQAGRFVSIEGDRVASPPPAAAASGTGWRSDVGDVRGGTASRPARILEGLRVLDISNIIAAPAAARVLAEFGAEVLRLDVPSPYAGPRMTMWYGTDVNQGKHAGILDLKSEDGKRVLTELVKRADVVIHNFLDSSTASLGIDEARLRAIKPELISCQVTAWGGPDGGAWKNFPAFDPVVQAATGITARFGSLDAPALHGSASCVDYITGYTAALGIAQALVSRRMGRGGSHVRTSLAMGALLVQFPFAIKDSTEGHKPHKPHEPHEPHEPHGQQALGYGAHDAIYEAADGWLALSARKSDLAGIALALKARDASYEGLSAAVRHLAHDELREALTSFTSAVVRVRRLDGLECIDRAKAEQNPSGLFPSLHLTETKEHPSGYPTALPLASWYRLAKTPVRALHPAQLPGTDTTFVLEQAGLEAADVDALLRSGVARNRWAVQRHYLPR